MEQSLIQACLTHWLDPDPPLPAPPQGLDWDRVYALLSWHRLTGIFYLQLAEGRAAILISRRFSTVRMADWMYVLEDGRIVESGTHEELVHRSGRYASLFETEAKYYR